jgi:hypothetical protein
MAGRREESHESPTAGSWGWLALRRHGPLQPTNLSLLLSDQFNQLPSLIPKLNNLLHLGCAHESMDIVNVGSRPLGKAVDSLVEGRAWHVLIRTPWLGVGWLRRRNGVSVEVQTEAFSAAFVTKRVTKWEPLEVVASVYSRYQTVRVTHLK